eukprot:UC1_evm3s2195
MKSLVSAADGKSATAATTAVADSPAFKAWFPGYTPVPPGTTCRLRLLCFPGAGGISRQFTGAGTARKPERNPLAEMAVNGVEILAVEMPGRNARRLETPLKSIDHVVTALLPVVAPLLRHGSVIDTTGTMLTSPPPYAIVGHSMGTWVGYAFALAAVRASLPSPQRLFLAAFPPPTTPLDKRPWPCGGSAKCALPTATHLFQDECRQWDINPGVFVPHIWSVFEPLLRNDYGMFTSYPQTNPPPHLQPTCGASIYYANEDRKVSKKLVEGWAEGLVHGSVSVMELQGNHMSIMLEADHRAAWFQAIAAEL